ncbi:prepilin peptidase [Ralstonia insidiosa]|uniref:prepilin peptidase n=1 Tax=Ralstonia insidiosa TaxID=190721 RepID=UPI000CEF4391|nr:A24 family peptidase [Ralstonia insidiosa]
MHFIERVMPDILSTAVLAAIVGLGAAAAMIYLIQVLPRREEAHWRLEVEYYMHEFERAATISPYVLTLRDKLIILVVAPAMTAAILIQQGVSVDSLLLCFYGFALVMLAITGIKHHLLPNFVVLPVLWAGLLQHAYFGSSAQAVFGAAATYVVATAFGALIQLRRGRELSLGGADAKCLAMAGAWFGITAVPTLLIVLAGTLLLWGTIRIFLRLPPDKPAPMAPAHVLASIVAAAGIRLL